MVLRRARARSSVKKRCQLEYRKSFIKPLPREGGGGLYISNRFEGVLTETGGLFERGSFSSSLKPGTKLFTWGKWIISYNFGIDDGTESKFGTQKELTVLNILKYEYCVNKSRDMSRDHFAKNCKLLTNWWLA